MIGPLLVRLFAQQALSVGHLPLPLLRQIPPPNPVHKLEGNGPL